MKKTIEIVPFLWQVRYLYALAVFCTMAGSFVESAEGEDNASVITAVVDKYVSARDIFFKQKRSEDARRSFFLAWRDRLVTAASLESGTDASCRALSSAEAISNSVRDYPTSVEILERIIADCPDLDGHWLVELGEVSEASWHATGDDRYCRKAIDSFLEALSGDKIEIDLRVLVSGWLSSLVKAELSTEDDIRRSLDHLNEAIVILKAGHQPEGRLVGTGFTVPWFVERGVLLAVLDHRYDLAQQFLAEHSKLEKRSLSAGEVLASVDRSSRIRLIGKKRLKNYIEFLDSWVEANANDPTTIIVRMIPGRRSFERDQLEEAKERFEVLLQNHQSEIDASESRSQILAEIWTMLRIIYSRLGDDVSAVKAAEHAIKAKQDTGQPNQGEVTFLEQKAKEREIGRGSFHTNNDSRDSYSLKSWLLVINVLIIGVVISIFAYRRSRRK